jgi:GMP synthase (glutamine-hydrolysing)
MKFTLLQARKPDDIAKKEEQYSFAKQLGVSVDNIDSIDIFSNSFNLGLLETSEVLLVGGAGEYSVLDNDNAIKGFIDFLGKVCNTNIPVFASCFGFQAMVLALGGEIIKDKSNAEVGTYLLSKTKEAEQDDLFSFLPNKFYAQLGHQDRASKLPGSVIHLAASEKTQYQAFKVKNKNIYATQFHPELTFEDNKKRFKRYMDIYGQLFGEERAQERMDSHRPSIEANKLLNKFYKMIDSK